MADQRWRRWWKRWRHNFKANNNLINLCKHFNLNLLPKKVKWTKKRKQGNFGKNIIIEVPLIFDAAKFRFNKKGARMGCFKVAEETRISNSTDNQINGKKQKNKKKKVVLELKTIADVGCWLNAGPRTLLSVVTNAKPKIANYQFTTIFPNLGVVNYYDNTFVMADIPGLIEGASEGLGLGHYFLKHIERVANVNSSC